jgi:anaerobic selenocysteine-containing dehydrogenase
MTSQLEITTVHGACPHDCPDTCSMLVDVQGGVVTGVRGNPDHPYTRGGLCTKVNDFEKHTYDSARILHPMRRTGPKGSGQFERISWDAAIAEICARFTEVRDTYGGEAILPQSYLGNMGIVNGLNVMDPFMHRLGASVAERALCSSGRSSAYVMTMGTSFIDPESLAHSKYIVVWGNNMISSNLHLWPFVREAQKNGAKVVVIDPYRSRTAARADWHVKVNPGTDGALALGMMNVIITEGLTDDEFVRAHTIGFDELAERAAEFPVERVEAITGVAAEDVRTLAREFATAQPAAIRVGVAVENHPQGGQALRAIYCLPALVGSWRQVGGGVVEMPLYGFPMNWEELSQTQWIKPGTRVVRSLQLGRALTGELELDPPIKALMVCNTNPMITVPEQNKVAAGLAREDLFTVVSELYMTDTARYADILLPATTALEHDDLMFSWGQTYLTMNNRSIEPLGEAVPNIELFRMLAKGMGFDDEWFSLTDDQVMERSLDWTAPQMQGITLDRLKREGFARLNLPPASEWAPYAEGGFATESGKVNLRLDGVTNFVLPVFREGYTDMQGDTPVDSLPNYVDEVVDPATPLRMITPRPHSFLNSQYANVARHAKAEKVQNVRLHPAQAAKRGIVDGQSVVVHNAQGEFEAVVKVSDDVVEDTLVAPYGYWSSLEKGGSTTSAVTSDELNDIGRAALFSHVPVDVRPA